MKKKKLPLILLPLIVYLVSCEQEFLGKKPSTTLIVPTTLDDFQRLMDDYTFMGVTPMLGQIGSDEYFFPNGAALDAQSRVEQRNGYLFKEDIYEGSESASDWDVPYRQVFVANVVLEGLGKSGIREPKAEVDRIKGQALFLRAHAFFNLVQLFSKWYDPLTADLDLGIPLRLEPGVDEPVRRASVKAVYEQVIRDLHEASAILPAELPDKTPNRASRPAVYGLLARIYLNMGDFPNAVQYADKSLELHSDLLDFNDVWNQTTPLPYNHKECLYQATLGTTSAMFHALLGRNTLVDTVLIQSYEEGDRRLQFFFKPASTHPGYYMLNKSYSGAQDPFGGIATDEIYLIKAECLARVGRESEAVEVLNHLRKYRFASEHFAPLTPENALEKVLAERRKELVFRGIRWMDLRRLNNEGYSIGVRRVLDNEVYELTPNTNRWVFPIPPSEIRLSGLEQNPR